MSHLPDGADLVAWVENGPAGSTWGPRRGLNRVAPGIERTLLIEAVRSAMADPTGHVVTIEERSGLRGLTTLLPKPIESQQLAVSTGAVGTCLTDSAGNRRHDTACLLRQVDREALERGIELLILRIDSDDAGALAAAQDCGYRVAEATVAWLAERQTTTPASLAGRLEVETFKGAAIRDALTSSEVAELAERTSNWRDNHFRADPRLTSEQVDRFYEVWVHNIASARWCDALHVARTDGRMVGLLSEVIDDAVLSC